MPKIKMPNKKRQKEITDFVKKRMKTEMQLDLAVEYDINLGTFKNKCSTGKTRTPWTFEDEFKILGEK